MATLDPLPTTTTAATATSTATATATSTSSTTTNNNTKNDDHSNKKKLTLIPLIFLIFFEVSGGPYGEEPTVAAAGNFYAILGFLVFPFIWSLPEALVTAELSTSFPGNGGYVLWSSAAFGPFWAHLMASWKFLSGAVNAAAYPTLLADYLHLHGGPGRAAATVSFTLGLSFVNYLGIAVVGFGGVVLGIAAVVPFVVMAAAAVGKVRPGRWLDRDKGGGKKDWGLFLNTLFWNLNYWDNVSTVAGEVERPRTTYPRALAVAGVLTCICYLVPLLSGTGALDVPRERWEDGFLADAAGMIAGKWLKYWVQAGSALSSVGLYEAQISSCAYQLLGMADLGYLPKAFSCRSRYFHTPWLAILLTTAITLSLSFLSFSDIIAAANFVYSLSMLLEFSAFLWLRRKFPRRRRPYRIPLRLPALFVVCLVPSAFLVLLMTMGNWKVYAIGVGLTSVGVCTYFASAWLEEKDWMEFEKEEVAAEMTTELGGADGAPPGR